MTIHRHIERFGRVIMEEVEKDAHGCSFRAIRQIKNFPTRGLIWSRKFTQVEKIGNRIRLIYVQRIVAEIPIRKRSVKGHIIPYERMLPLRRPRRLVRIVVNVVDPN